MTPYQIAAVTILAVIVAVVYVKGCLLLGKHLKDSQAEQDAADEAEKRAWESRNMANKSEDQIATEVLREVECRIVWLATFLVVRAKSHGGSGDVAKIADQSLDQYKARFAPIGPDGV